MGITIYGCGHDEGWRTYAPEPRPVVMACGRRRFAASATVTDRRWHDTLEDEPYPDTSLDLPIRR